MAVARAPACTLGVSKTPTDRCRVHGGETSSHQLWLWSSAVQPEGLLETLLAHTCRSPPTSRRVEDVARPSVTPLGTQDAFVGALGHRTGKGSPVPHEQGEGFKQDT